MDEEIWNFDMRIRGFSAQATTKHVELGEETQQGSTLAIRQRAFTDLVASDEPWMVGENRPVMSMDLDAETFQGDLSGTFVLTPLNLEGSWVGELVGRLEGGKVSAVGLAIGHGVLAGAALRVDFQQVERLDNPPPCETPLAYFRMEGFILAP